MERSEFEKVVEEAMEQLPDEFARNLENIDITIEDTPARQKAGAKLLLLGLYQGVPLEKRSHYYAGALPDKITLYQRNIEAVCGTKEEMVEQIKRTLLHEIGHYFGISDKRLRELGY
jgi:predicted Zn-dependent protease with MMP-like domain